MTWPSVVDTTTNNRYNSKTPILPVTIEVPPASVVDANTNSRCYSMTHILPVTTEVPPTSGELVSIATGNRRRVGASRKINDTSLFD